MNQKSQKPRDPQDPGARPDDTAPRAAPDGEQADPAMQGEGNRTAARRYNEETTEFTRSGRVDEAARSARPSSADEARDMERAEAEGKSHAREEDPLLQEPAQPGGRSDQVNGKGSAGKSPGDKPSGRPTRH